MENLNTLKIGFIGGGINSAVGDTHRIASQMDGRWKLVSGCFSTHIDINRKSALEYGVLSDRVYGDWEQMLEYEKDKIDAVCILTPTNIHSGMLVKALELGYPVICEKAMVHRVEDAEKICQLVKNKNSFFAVTYNYTGYPMVRELRNIVDNGELGRIIKVVAEMPQEGFIRFTKNNEKPHPQSWRLDDGEIPTISLDLGVHIHNLIYFLTKKKPVKVVAVENTFGHFKDIVDDITCMIEYSDDVSGQIWYSKSAIGHRNGLKIRIYGEKASAEWIQINPEIITLYDNVGNINIIDRAANVNIADLRRYNRFKAGHPSGFIEAFGNYYYDLADELINYKNNMQSTSPYIFGAEHAKEGLELLRIMHKSSQLNKWINVELDK